MKKLWIACLLATLPNLAFAAITYSPAAVAIPATGGIALFLLALALTGLATRYIRKKDSARFMVVAALVVGALMSSVGGIKLVSLAYAAAKDFENPAGGVATIDCALDQEHINLSGVPIKVDSIDCTPGGGTLGAREVGDPSPECSAGLKVAAGTSCWTFTPACTNPVAPQGPITVGPGFNDATGVFVPFPSGECFDRAYYLALTSLLVDINRAKTGGGGTDQIEFYWASSATDVASTAMASTNTTGNSTNVPRNHIAAEAPTGSIKGLFIKTTGTATWSATVSNIRFVP